MLEGWQPRSLRACSRDDPECGARRGVPRWRLRNRSPREAREVARQALRPGCEELAVTDPAQMPAVAKLWRACSKSAEASAEADAGERSAAPGAQNRHGGAPRGERPASWDARRLASAWPAASCAGPTGASHAPERFSALRPPLDSGSVKQRMQNPGRKSAPRERDGLFEIVSWPETRCCPHPEERAC